MIYTSSASFSPRGTQLLFELANSVGFSPLAEIKQADFSGQKLDLADVTNFQSGIFREYLPTLLDSGDLTYKGNFIPGDSSQAQLLNFFNSATFVVWKVVLPTNPANGLPLGHFTFNGFVTSLEWGLPIDKEGTISGKIKITGPISYIAGS